MKKIGFVLCFILWFSFLQVNAYSIVNVVNNTSKYEQTFKSKINFSKYNTNVLEKLKIKIENAISSTESNSKLTDTKKETLLWQLTALSNLVSTEISNRTKSSNVVVTIIWDKRCTNCMTEEITTQIKQTSFLASAKFVIKDFSDIWVSDYLKENSISHLPVVILSTNDLGDEWTMTPYLSELNDKQFSLNVWSTFDPFLERSSKWFLIIDKTVLDSIKTNTYLKWNKDAKISWIEYSDLECPYCAKFHNSDVETKINKDYSWSVNKYFNNFPLSFHQNAFSWALVLECLWEQKWSDAFYSLMSKAYSDEKSEETYLIDESVNLWADKQKLEDCVNSLKYSQKVINQMSSWSTVFAITWTPASILVNNETWEFDVISWAYPYENFKWLIDKLLK